MRWSMTTLGLLTLVLIMGCQGENGPERHRVSGTVEFDGKPIPYGDVLFTPDDSKKNSGAQGIATIRDGNYDTSASGGKGYGGGSAVIRVTGLTKQGGKLLCEWEFQVDLPRGEATHNIVVPPEAKPKQRKGPEI
jgi:hypothetical protein